MTKQSLEQRIHRALNSAPQDDLPYIIELAGLPRVGKTEFSEALIDLIRRSKCKGVVCSDEAEWQKYDKWDLDFTAWGISNFIKRFFEYKYFHQQIIVADRGLFDSLIWLKLKLMRGICDRKTYDAMRNFILLGPWWKHQVLVLVFIAPIDVAISRAEERRLYRKESLVTNEEILNELMKEYKTEGATVNQIEEKDNKPQLVKFLRADGKDIRNILFEAAEIVIKVLEQKGYK